MADWLEDHWYAALGWVAEHPIALFALVFMAACVVYLALTKNPQQVESTRSSAKLALEIILFLAIFGVARSALAWF